MTLTIDEFDEKTQTEFLHAIKIESDRMRLTRREHAEFFRACLAAAIVHLETLGKNHEPVDLGRFVVEYAKFWKAHGTWTH